MDYEKIFKGKGKEERGVEVEERRKCVTLTEHDLRVLLDVFIKDIKDELKKELLSNEEFLVPRERHYMEHEALREFLRFYNSTRNSVVKSLIGLIFFLFVGMAGIILFFKELLK